MSTLFGSGQMRRKCLFTSNAYKSTSTPCYSMDKWVLCNLLLAKFSAPSKMLVVSSSTIRFSKEPQLSSQGAFYCLEFLN